VLVYAAASLKLTGFILCTHILSVLEYYGHNCQLATKYWLQNKFVTTVLVEHYQMMTLESCEQLAMMDLLLPSDGAQATSRTQSL